MLRADGSDGDGSPFDWVLSAGSAIVDLETIFRVFCRSENRVCHVVHGNQIGYAVELSVEGGENSGAECDQKPVRAVVIVYPSWQGFRSSS